MVYNRENKTVNKDTQYGGKYLNFLYNNFLGRLILKIVISPVFSKINGKYNKMAISKNKINHLMTFLLERKNRYIMTRIKIAL